MSSFSKFMLGLLFTAMISGLIAKPALAELSIIPTRILFEDRERFEEVILINTGKRTNTYDLKWEFMRMIGGDSEVTYEPVESSVTEFDLTKYIVFSPRRVTIAPGGRQKIRLALRRPADVPAGEYRAHLKFSPLPPDQGAENRPSEHPTAAVNIRFGFSIPVVFQAGPLDVQTQIEAFTFARNEKNGRLQAKVKISRSGVHGAQGHLFIYDPKGNVIGEVSNAHIFSEADSRVFTVPLQTEDISGQTITVEYRHFEKEKNLIFANRQFPIQ